MYYEVSKQIVEDFQNLFSNSENEEKQLCKHQSIYEDGSRQRVCNMCGIVFETIDFEQAWCDLNRCYSHQSKPIGIRKVFQSLRIDF